MELGNLIFGHSRGEWPIPRGAGYEEELVRLFKAFQVKFPGEDISYGIEYDGPVFEAHRYYWGECECGDACHCGASRPNFHHKPTGLTIMWYKYPLRDSYANREVSLDEFSQIIDGCLKSL